MTWRRSGANPARTGIPGGDVSEGRPSRDEILGGQRPSLTRARASLSSLATCGVVIGCLVRELQVHMDRSYSTPKVPSTV
jgi:hypothetical protein